MAERNAYLILGVDFAASKDEARRQFAQAARRIRRSPNGSVSVEDLTWALNEIETTTADPRDSVTVFRVPANPQVFTPHGEGLFLPPPVPLARQTQTTPADIDGLRRKLVDELQSLLDEAADRTISCAIDYEFSEDA